MANESLHKGWLYARNGLKFAPYVLTESIVNRDGTTWANVVDGKVADLETAVGVINNTSLPNLQNEVNAVEDRATILERRTQYLNAEDSDAFYITDASGWVCFKVNGIGASSTNFTTPVTDLNSLKQTTDDIGAAVAQLQNVSISELRGLITELQERTKYMDASTPDNAFYFTDGYGNVIARIDGNGITSINFTSEGVTDLNSLNEAVNGLKQADLDLAGLLGALTDRAKALEERTKYMNASSVTGEFVITDANGNIGMKVDNSGTTSSNFIIPGLTSLSQLDADLKKEINDRANADQELRDADNALGGAINTNASNITKLDNNLSPRVQNLEARTKYLNASVETGIFAITDKDGNIGMQVDNSGVTSTDFVIQKNASTKASVKEILDNLNQSDSDLAGQITQVNTQLTNKINTVESNLTTLIGTTKADLQTEIDNTESAINKTIEELATRLDQKDADLAGQISNVNTTLNNKIDSTKSNLQNEIKTTKENLEKSISDTDTSIRTDMASLAKELKDKDNEFTEAIGDLTPRMVAVETRTQHINAVDNNGVFQVVDGEGNIGMQVDGNGVTANKFIIQTKGNINTQIPVIGYQITGQITI